MGLEIVRERIGGIWKTSAKPAPSGGGSQPVTREEWTGNGVPVDPGGFEWQTWDASGGPDAVLDATNSKHPTIITAGVYVGSVTVTPSGRADGIFTVGLYLDRQGFNASQSAVTYADHVTGNTDAVTVAFAWYLPAGATVEVGLNYTNATTPETPGGGGFLAHLQRVS